MKANILAVVIAATTFNTMADTSASQIITTTIPTVCGVNVKTGSVNTIDMTGQYTTQTGHVTFVVTRNSTTDLIDTAITVSHYMSTVEYIDPSHGIADVWDVSVFKNGSSTSGSFDTSNPTRITKSVNGAAPNDEIKVQLDVDTDDVEKLEGGQDHKLTVSADVTCA